MGNFIALTGLLLLMAFPIARSFLLRPRPKPTLQNLFSSLDDFTPSDPSSASPSPTEFPVMYASSLAMIPPPSAWPPIQSLRITLKDAGIYRWPPHVNLLYPFVAPNKFNQVSLLLQSALQDFEPFKVKFNKFNVFGNAGRGVLWLQPEYDNETSETLVTLQNILQQTLPYCHHQQKSGTFTPHMTISHFKSKSEAEKLGSELEFEGVEFLVDRIYLMSRNGQDGQFKKGAEVIFGGERILYEYGELFEKMEEVEFEWVARERKEMQQRRKRKKRKQERTS
ncbi:hypothetical protein TrLO_g5762 [Triparma laevis f. longispina]|uniref:Uncharacterized protein n=1 Tax=Triparma laevis f. longispina TaxID=1714387 RepID=A0A9W7FH18_9STRA|nr:hypothetical protein TrLO_g5762 [Triparma laevis f. longispina]